ncbi:NAD(P)H-flavin oxidoreductase [Desulfuromonas versatilis]|uniref:NAD(P)H-flavin oxidoreductase n=1 Tax=Desulfuromonas versatilis TaxID=2802975 RepID=A0ABM8HTL9_9BACT|nr:nitroreductase family protein [Desulfuromonas versatilis]BCR04373.1 NAD(P)H-flavin oxidoreductase [Desulfuromonas versatilis]
MTRPTHNGRTPEVEVDSMFLDRWSPRSFCGDPIPEPHLAALFEAARWAPSCYNEQPWLFVYARSAEDRERFATALVEKNRQWAARAPLLLFVLARKSFARNGKPNRHAVFDAGAAWMSLALQARRLGLYAHGMAGFSRERAAEVTGADPEEYEIMAAVAVGYRDEVEKLPEDLAAMESPNGRKPPGEVAAEGRVPG